MSSTIIYVVVMLLILGFLYIAYYFYFVSPRNKNINLYKIPLLTSETVFTEDYINGINIPPLITPRTALYIPKLGYGLTFSWDMYIPAHNSNDKWQNNYNFLKPIITMGDSPVISYHPKKNYLSISVKYRNNPFYTQFSEIKFKDMRLQKWSQYILLIENRNIRLFINGKLVSTKTLPSVLIIPDISNNIVLGEQNNNFLGKINNLTLYPYPLSYEEIESISNIALTTKRNCEGSCDTILN